MGSIRKEIKGNCYGDWTALGEFYYKTMPSGRKVLMEKCRCKCGVEKYVQRQHLISGNSANCGCEKSDRLRKTAKIISKKHGMEGTIPYKKFMSAKARCNDKNNDRYYRYGGRGIKMVRKNFSEFWNDMGEGYYEHVKKYGEKNTTIDRIDVNGNYCKENCRWATWQEQRENMSTNHNVVYKGKWYPTIASMCRELGKKIDLVRDRILAGWTVEDAVDKPLSPTSKYYVKKKGLRAKRDYIQQTPHFTTPPLW